MYTLAETVTDAREILNESTAAFFTDAEIKVWAWDATIDISIRTQCNQGSGDVSTTASRTADASGVSSTSILTMPYASYGLNGLRKMLERQDGHIGTGASYPAITPKKFWERKGYIGIEPLPTAIYSIHLYVAETPSAWTVDGDTADLPLPFRHLILPYVLIRAYIKDEQWFTAIRLYGIYLDDTRVLTAQYSMERIEGRQSYKMPDMVMVQ